MQRIIYVPLQGRRGHNLTNVWGQLVRTAFLRRGGGGGEAGGGTGGGVDLPEWLWSVFLVCFPLKLPQV